MSEKLDLRKNIDNICKIVQNKFGKESINYLGNNKIENIPRLKTQSTIIDDLLGGGYPIGRIIELYGPESAGKSTLCYHAIASAQQQFPNTPVALIDVEYSLDRGYANGLGVDVSNLLLSQPDSGQDALDILITLIENGVKFIVVDSVAALLPKEEAEDESTGTNSMGLQARMMSKSLRKINQVTGKNQATLFFTNQIRQKIGVMFGEKTTTPGGDALKFYSSVRIKLTRIGLEADKQGGEKVASKVKVDITKNKTYAPFKRGEIIIRFGTGVDEIEPLIDRALENEVIIQKGAWFSMGDQNVAQGRSALRNLLNEDKEMFNDVKSKILAEHEKKDEQKKQDTNNDKKESKKVDISDDNNSAPEKYSKGGD